jgi:hypothetical protein
MYQGLAINRGLSFQFAAAIITNTYLTQNSCLSIAVAQPAARPAGVCATQIEVACDWLTAAP